MDYSRNMYDAQPRRGAYHNDPLQSSFEIVPEERIGRQLPRRRRRFLVRLTFLLCVAGAGWAVYDDPSRLPRWWTVIKEAAAPVVEKALEQSANRTDTGTSEPARADAGGAVFNPFASSNPERAGSLENPALALNSDAGAAVPDKEQSLAAPPKVIAVAPPVAEAKEQNAKAPADALLDANLEQAKKAGLHPGLSRVVLRQLSKADFANAKIAIDRALVNTPDDETLQWPKRRKAGLAIFEVHFVPGAGANCRRYVVTIEKKKWLTTALPMVRCGVRVKAAAAKVASPSAPAKAKPKTEP